MKVENVKLKTKAEMLRLYRQELLDQIEQSVLIIGGEIVIVKTGLVRARIDIIEEHLGKIMDATLDLKQIDGIPSNLKKVEK